MLSNSYGLYMVHVNTQAWCHVHVEGDACFRLVVVSITVNCVHLHAHPNIERGLVGF